MMRATAVQLLKVKPVPASAIPLLRLPPSTTSHKATSITSTAARSRTASVDVAAQLENKLVSRQGLGANVRISKPVSNKDLYWKVPKAQRDILKKLLKEA
ncbi:uncharacterized protein UMAG_10707 [Mycosarcoma maydis]|uniref:Uncharacterized protein n=1 Tax=Mycosarcoma maydis TaxID=5270 RepID=A0A0D1DS88_MYCMD|nr:uncharacterized protein UMAG_10707 [Ustilago maydis 521]KIS67149.1 hypothetical protein UMAG_10707 [Ustilago maydis 521]|eukprot:XP_011391350.1 hypothetical protein UMAG_10707 [Ustilago maydis 521]